MAITRWTGGELGTELMPANIVSSFYTKVFREVPPVNYHDGITSTTYFSRQLIQNGTLHVFVNNSEVPHVIMGINQFKINDPNPGYVRITYSPPTTVYFSDNKTYANNTNVITFPVKTTRNHIYEILNSLNSIADFVETKRPVFSVSELNNGPAIDKDFFNANTPILSVLFDEISAYIIYLYQFCISKLDINIIVPQYTLYNYKTIDGKTLEQYRYDINSLETVIGI